MSGDHYSALVLNKTIAVNGWRLTITIHPTKGNTVIINAIEIFEVIAAESKTLPVEGTSTSLLMKTLQTLKSALQLPLRFGWNGDPSVPQQHPWSGVDCHFDSVNNNWVIVGLNLSGNAIRGPIPSSLGSITSLWIPDLSYNSFNGSIPESLGQLTSLQILNLNGNALSGRHPAALGGSLLHGASFNFTDNAGLCGIPGLPTCAPHLSIGAEIGVAFGVCVAILLMVICAKCWWTRRQNILRARRIAGMDFSKAS
ncbi:hypothetical protein RJ641_018348 [Dillenia turbinata]|uniref:Uncharacterized protein n=1 Tax=Dillenia turbinata TaxID=194707 RepID=A0AAN8YYI1_9MAGN